MAISVFDLFKVGIGPSSSHTVGPMKAARRFVTGLHEDGLLPRTGSVRAELFGSLGATGHGSGSGSGKAVLLGLEGEDPETVDTDTVDDRVHRIHEAGRLRLLGRREVEFREREHLVLHRRRTLPFHPNGMVFTARDHDDREVRARTYYSVGGGFVVDGSATGADRIKPDDTPVPLPFGSASELLLRAYETSLPISRVVLANELSRRSESEVRAGLLRIWRVMQECVERGCSRTETTLPGRLQVPRRAPQLLRSLAEDSQDVDPLHIMDWVNLFALAVNEENASGGRVVTAPTNGAAGIVPAVLHYYTRFVYTRFVPGADEDGVVRFLLAAGVVGALFKKNASISGAEVGCQGEVGSACSMAAAGLAEALGGTPEQVENAAEIGMEHNLGLTCDPVGGLVQIPCIERNALASVKAINAARMALRGDGTHVVSLDKVIKTTRETGADMKVKYKETSRGGLAVNVIEC
ncbi:L-serine ammonia-lyase [Streptomyces sp. NPDC002758]